MAETRHFTSAESEKVRDVFIATASFKYQTSEKTLSNFIFGFLLEKMIKTILSKKNMLCDLYWRFFFQQDHFSLDSYRYYIIL